MNKYNAKVVIFDDKGEIVTSTLVPVEDLVESENAQVALRAYWCLLQQLDWSKTKSTLADAQPVKDRHAYLEEISSRRGVGFRLMFSALSDYYDWVYSDEDRFSESKTVSRPQLSQFVKD
jgi:hypothetical protein